MFILWKLYEAYKNKDMEIIKKGINLVEYLTKSAKGSVFGEYGGVVFSLFSGITFFYFVLALVYAVLQHGKTSDLQIVLMFFTVFIAAIAYSISTKTIIPLFMIIGVGILLNIVSSLLALVSLGSVPVNAKKEYVHLPPNTLDKFNIYRILTLTSIGILLILALLLFTRNFKLSIADYPNNIVLYNFNNGFAIFLSFALVFISSYNIYGTNKLMGLMTNTQISV
jgi:hypothetical protein